MNIRHLILAAFVSGIPAVAYATPASVPEPESLALVGIGAVALIIARWAKRK